MKHFDFEQFVFQEVIHITLGIGKIDAITNTMITVVFNNGDIKKFAFPSIFQSFLKFRSPGIQNEIDKLIKVDQELSIVENERKRSDLERVHLNRQDKQPAKMVNRSVGKTSKSKITMEMAECSYKYAREVYHGKMTLNDAAESVYRESGMNPSSAFEYISDFQNMMAGDVYKRAMKNADSKLFIENIMRDYGLAFAQKAIKATWAHIAYYEDISKSTMIEKRRILKEFEKSL